MLTKAPPGTAGDRRKYNRAILYFSIGLTIFFLCLLTCIGMIPAGLWANHGFCYYGDWPATVGLYRTAFVTCGLCLLLASFSLPRMMPFLGIRIVFWIMFPLLCGVAISNVPNTTVYGKIHIGVSVTLFVVQVLASTWLALVVSRNRVNITLFILLIFGAALSLIALLCYCRYMIEGQMVFLLGFGLLIIHTLIRLRAQVIT